MVLLLQGTAADPNIRASRSAVALVGAFLVVLGVALVTAGIGLLRGRRRFWVLGLWCTVRFVIDGAINDSILFGRPGDRGTVVYLIVVALFTGCLLAGRTAPTLSTPTKKV